MQRSLILLFSLLVGCTHATFKYEASIQHDSLGDYEFIYSHTYPTDNEYWCGFTAMFYGGACWSYLSMPNNEQADLLVINATSELNKQIGDNRYKTTRSKVSRVNWGHGIIQNNLIALGPVSNQHRSVASYKTKGDISPEDFEKTIIEKRSKKDLTSSGENNFPKDWPNKWYYETKEYRYWTVVGKSAIDPTEAMKSSKNKADSIISFEFNPSQYKRTMPYQTTHNEVAIMGSAYKSWRIIRVKQSDAIMLLK
jgi:hypothetical protein